MGCHKAGAAKAENGTRQNGGLQQMVAQTSSFAAGEPGFRVTQSIRPVHTLAILYLLGCIIQYLHLKIFSRLFMLMHACNLSTQVVKKGISGVQG